MKKVGSTGQLLLLISLFVFNHVEFMFYNDFVFIFYSKCPDPRKIGFKLGRLAVKYLENYVHGIRSLFYQHYKIDYLFLSLRGGKIGFETLRYLIQRYVEKARLKKHVTTHTFRRSCATGMIKNNANLIYVKDILPHASLDTLNPYCALEVTDLKKAHKKFHPREKKTK